MNAGTRRYIQCMNRESRILTLEKDVAELRIRTDIGEVEREEIRLKITDLRAETRGWARTALSADGKADAAAILMGLIYTDIRQMKDTLAEHGRRLDGIDGRLDGIDGTLHEHGELLRKILAKLS